jgi:hypothetical protein
MPSKQFDQIKDLLIRRNRCLYKYANGIRKYKEALKKLKELESALKITSHHLEGKTIKTLIIY